MESLEEVLYAMFQTKSESPIEAMMYLTFKKLGVDVEQQVTIGNYRADYVLGKVVIECDGADYHEDARDLKRDACIYKHGYRIVRVPGHCLSRYRFELVSYLIWRYAPDKCTEAMKQRIPREINYNLVVREFVPDQQPYYQNLFVKL